MQDTKKTSFGTQICFRNLFQSTFFGRTDGTRKACFRSKIQNDRGHLNWKRILKKKQFGFTPLKSLFVSFFYRTEQNIIRYKFRT